MTGPVARLVVVTLVWGTSFPCTHAWQAASKGAGMDALLSALTLIALRMLLALALLLLWQPKLRRATAAEHGAGAAVGLTFLAGFVLQTWALASTTPALSGFFTSLTSAWAPLLLMLMGRPVPALTLAGLGLGLVGCAVMVDHWTPGAGEWLTLAASALFAVEMLLLDGLGKALRAERFTLAFLFVNAAGAGLLGVMVALAGPGVGAWLGWLGAMLGDVRMAGLVVLLAALPTALGFHWMNENQPKVDASRAALIYLLEPVFATAFSLAVGADRLSPPLLWGGVLILAGNLVVIGLERPKRQG